MFDFVSLKVDSSVWIQKQKRNEEEYSRKLKELQSELASTNELCQKLERKVCQLGTQPVCKNNRQRCLEMQSFDFLAVGKLPSKRQRFAWKQAKGVEGNYK